MRLTVDGKSFSQPIVVKMDPRVKLTPDVQRIFALTTQVENQAANLIKARKEAGASTERLKGQSLDEIIPADLAAQLVATVMPLQAAEMAPTARELAAITERQAAYTAAMAKWNALNSK